MIDFETIVIITTGLKITNDFEMIIVNYFVIGATIKSFMVPIFTIIILYYYHYPNFDIFIVKEGLQT